MYAYVGCRTTRERNARGKGISVFQVDPRTARLELIQLLDGLVNPSFLAFNEPGNRLYSVHGDTTQISAFIVDTACGTLTHLNTQDTQGENPVHLALDKPGRHIVVSNHIGASLAVLPLAPDGSLQPVSQRIPLEGPVGPHRIEQKQAKPHFNPFSPDHRYVIVPDKGLDRIFTFRFSDGKLEPADPFFIMTREASGPRHIVFHPSARFAYCINELESSVTTYRYDIGTGALTPLQILSSLPQTYTGNNRASEIMVDRQGRHVYASNRGHDSIAVFRIDPNTGLLTWGGAHDTNGRTPRYMALTPDGRFMYALNEDSDSIVAFHVDAATGGLWPTGLSIASSSPVCMVFSPLRA